MVCNRCKVAVKAAFERNGISTLSIQLGEVETETELLPTQKEKLGYDLKELGFALIDDKKSRIIEKVKTLIVALVHQQDGELVTNLSTYLSNNLHLEYKYLTSLFSEVEGTTIEKYFIAQKIEKVKELLVYDELSLGEIAFRLQYSSVAHLSNQFKKVTGLTPSYFKQLGSKKRKSLDEV